MTPNLSPSPVDLSYQLFMPFGNLQKFPLHKGVYRSAYQTLTVNPLGHNRCRATVVALEDGGTT